MKATNRVTVKTLLVLFFFINPAWIIASGANDITLDLTRCVNKIQRVYIDTAQGDPDIDRMVRQDAQIIQNHFPLTFLGHGCANARFDNTYRKITDLNGSWSSISPQMLNEIDEIQFLIVGEFSYDETTDDVEIHTEKGRLSLQDLLDHIIGYTPKNQPMNVVIFMIRSNWKHSSDENLVSFEWKPRDRQKGLNGKELKVVAFINQFKIGVPKAHLGFADEFRGSALGRRYQDLLPIFDDSMWALDPASAIPALMLLQVIKNTLYGNNKGPIADFSLETNVTKWEENGEKNPYVLHLDANVEYASTGMMSPRLYDMGKVSIHFSANTHRYIAGKISLIKDAENKRELKSPFTLLNDEKYLEVFGRVPTRHFREDKPRRHYITGEQHQLYGMFEHSDCHAIAIQDERSDLDLYLYRGKSSDIPVAEKKEEKNNQRSIFDSLTRDQVKKKIRQAWASEQRHLRNRVSRDPDRKVTEVLDMAAHLSEDGDGLDKAGKVCLLSGTNQEVQGKDVLAVVVVKQEQTFQYLNQQLIDGDIDRSAFKQQLEEQQLEQSYDNLIKLCESQAREKGKDRVIDGTRQSSQTIGCEGVPDMSGVMPEMNAEPEFVKKIQSCSYREKQQGTTDSDSDAKIECSNTTNTTLQFKISTAVPEESYEARFENAVANAAQKITTEFKRGRSGVERQIIVTGFASTVSWGDEESISTDSYTLPKSFKSRMRRDDDIPSCDVSDPWLALEKEGAGLKNDAASTVVKAYTPEGDERLAIKNVVRNILPRLVPSTKKVETFTLSKGEPYRFNCPLSYMRAEFLAKELRAKLKEDEFLGDSFKDYNITFIYRGLGVVDIATRSSSFQKVEYGWIEYVN